MATKQPRGDWATVRSLGEHLWPPGHVNLKVRVVLAMFALIAAKGVNVYVPFLYKGAVDALSMKPEVIMPVALIVGYGLARIMQQSFGELRDFIFARVSQHAQRTVALQTFRHLHELSLAFHLDRQTGGLSRVIERGTRAIQTVLSFMLFNIIPTIIEILLVSGILYFKFGWIYPAVTLGMIAVYIAFTFGVTNWRTKYRRSMNERDTEANTKAIDSLLNFETVKYFVNEEHEYGRYDDSLAQYQTAALKSQSSLSMLNIGQGMIVGAGLIAVMWMTADGVAKGYADRGRFRFGEYSAFAVVHPA